MKKYRSYKVVEAGKIASFEEGPEATIVTLESGEVYSCSAKLFARGYPDEDGAYLMRYDDGYTSWSPAGPFEAGYAVIEDDRPRSK